jgi:hypothetical protein
VSPHCSRKSFFVKLGGLLAVSLSNRLAAVGIAPALLAKSAAAPTAVASPVALRPEQRAVAREEGSY